MIVDETNRRIEESLPLTKPTGKIRIETRGTYYEYEQPFASRKSRFTHDNYVEWQISYDTDEAPPHKLRDPLRRYNAEGPEGLRDRQSLDTIFGKRRRHLPTVCSCTPGSAAACPSSHRGGAGRCGAIRHPPRNPATANPALKERPLFGAQRRGRHGPSGTPPHRLPSPNR